MSEILHPSASTFQSWMKSSIPTFRIKPSGTQAITTGTTPVEVVFDAISADRWSGLSSSVWTVPTGAGGHYCFSAEGIQFDSNATGDRYVSIERVAGGAVTLGELLVPAAANSATKLSAVAFLIPAQPGNTFRVTVYQDSGSTLNISSRSRFMGYLVGGASFV